MQSTVTPQPQFHYKIIIDYDYNYNNYLLLIIRRTRPAVLQRRAQQVTGGPAEVSGVHLRLPAGARGQAGRERGPLKVKNIGYTP